MHTRRLELGLEALAKHEAVSLILSIPRRDQQLMGGSGVQEEAAALANGTVLPSGTETAPVSRF
jgi:hypothetical protein